MGNFFDFRRTVLIVDDEEVNRAMLAEILKEKYDVLCAENGVNAMTCLREKKDKISLVLLDLLMPEMDGYAVLSQMQQDADLAKIPVIVLTSEKDAEVKSLEAGAADFLTKPYNMPQVIQARVRRSIELAEDSHIIKSTETDALTGLYTKEFFFEYAQQLNRREPNRVMDSIVINLTNFHMINEFYGRDFGDKVLRSVGEVLKQLSEEMGGIACRYNADGFFLYIQQHWDYDKPINRITVHLSKLLSESEIQVRVGICQGSFRTSSLELNFDRALLACNSLRDNYGSKFVLYDKEMQAEENRNTKLLTDFATAVEEKQFNVVYQPKYNIKGKFPVLSSMEALVRWNHADFGTMQPDLFIPQFEKNGLIQQLDRYVWKATAEQMKAWHEEFGVNVAVSVNVSRIDLYDPKTPEYLMQLVKENGIPIENFILEITESAYTKDTKQIVSTIKDLRSQGFRIEMDDFGSGYSSLNMLAVMPVDALKLDMEFIKNIVTDKKSFYILRVVLEIARNFKIPVIAEGVETWEQFELLKKAGCDIIQGFYFSKPILPQDFGNLIKGGVKTP